MAPAFRIFALSVAAIVFVLALTPAFAQERGLERLYTVYGIDVDETAKTAAEARRIAIAKAQGEAFDELITRLVPDEAMVGFSLPQGAEASDYLLGFEVVEEKNSPVRYIATLNISFDPEKMEQLFGLQGIPYVAIPPEPALVFPVQWTEGGWLLWEDDNVFRQAWQDSADPNHVVDLRLPKGTLPERASITAEQLLAGRQKARILELAATYGAREARVATARMVRATWGGVERLEVEMTSLPSASPPLLLTLYPEADESEEVLLARGVEAILDRLDEEWKQRSLTQFGAFQEIALTIPAETSAEWAEVVARLKSASVVRQVAVRRLSLPDSIVTVRYQGTIEQLALALEQRGLVLFSGETGYGLARREALTQQR